MITSPLEGPLVRPRDWREADVPQLREWLRPHHEWHRWDAPYFGRTYRRAGRPRVPLRRRRGVCARPADPATRLVIADAGSGNQRMCRVEEKLDWTLEAWFRQARVVDGQHFDSVVYGVLRSEWLARLKRLASG